MQSQQSAVDSEWRGSFSQVGPFHALQRRLGLVSPDKLNAGRRALLFAALAWLPAAVLAALQGFAIDEHHARALLLDFSGYAMIIAIVAFVLMEQTADRRMSALVAEFGARNLIAASARPQFARARQAMERRAGAWWAEATILVLAYWLAFRWLTLIAKRIDGGTWQGQVVQGHLQPTLAGWWALLVTVPLFLFLLGRWLWRFAVWARLLKDIAHCDLRLVATNPDRCGGLAFIGQYPSTYLLFVFALSTVLSAGVLKSVVYAGASLAGFKFAALGLVLFLLVSFVLPLLAFAPTLRRLKRNGLRQYGGLISQHHQAFEARWIEPGSLVSGEQALGSPDMSSLADLSASHDLVERILPAPLTKEGVLPLLLASILPMIAVAATQMPFKQILGTLKGLLVL